MGGFRFYVARVLPRRSGARRPDKDRTSRRDRSSNTVHLRCSSQAVRRSQLLPMPLQTFRGWRVLRFRCLERDNPHARPLLEALKAAKMQATVPPIQDRIKACNAHLERARKRVGRADAVIARALEQKSIFDGEVADGEKRLQESQLEEAQGPVLAPSPEVAELQQQIDDLVRERQLLRASQSRIPREQPGQWCANGPPRGVGRVDQRTELQSQECSRIRQCRDHHTDWNSVEPRHRTVVARLERCCDGRAVKVIVDGVDDRRVRRQAKVGARWRSSSCAPFHVGEPSVRVHSVWVGPLQLMPVHHRQCEGLPTVTRGSRYGYRGAWIGEGSNPGPSRTRARARMEQEAEVALTGLEAAIHVHR